jgi:membrane protease YdiL (CAAX protease family)
MMHMNRLRLVEMTGIFVGVPLILSEVSLRHIKIVAMFAVSIGCLVLLLRDKTFDRKWLGLNGFRNWRMLVLRFTIIAFCLALYMTSTEPESAFVILRRNPAHWALIMIIYPFLSAVPQEVIFRSFFFHRYGLLFTERKLSVLTNAALFALAHIFFKNWIAIIGAFAAGILLAMTYLGSRSLMVTSIEHALYGDLIFTLGIGYYFYNPDF